MADVVGGPSEAAMSGSRMASASPTLSTKAACTIQRTFRGHRDRKSNIIPLLKESYQIGFDSESGSHYYYNVRTKESSWTKPLLYLRYESYVQATDSHTSPTLESAIPHVAEEVDKSDSFHTRSSNYAAEATGNEEVNQSEGQIASERENETNSEVMSSSEENEKARVASHALWEKLSNGEEFEAEPEESASQGESTSQRNTQTPLLTIENLQNLRKAYNEVDKLHRGFISGDEALEMLNILGLHIDHTKLESLKEKLDIHSLKADGGLTMGQITEIWEELNREKEESDPLFSEQQMELIRKQFAYYDADGSGTINFDELRTLLQTFFGQSPPDEEIEDILKNYGGHLNFDSFLEVLCDKMENKDQQTNIDFELLLVFPPEELAALQKQFNDLDQDKSGEIDLPELRSLVKLMGLKAGDEELRQLIAEADGDGSGTISFTEFLKIIISIKTNSGGALAALFNKAILSGVLSGLGNVLKSVTEGALSWWNQKEALLRERREQMLLDEERLEREAQERLESDLNKLQRKQDEEDALMKEKFRAIGGLTVETLHVGDGIKFPMKGDHIRVHYEIKLENGFVVESTRARGRAFDFQIGEGYAVLGFERGVMRMSEGETAKITCAPALAYGEKGFPPKIPGMSTLVMHVELIKVYGKLKKTWAYRDDASAN